MYLCRMSDAPIMEIEKAEFFTSSSDFHQCPEGDRPEYAFIGRSNVGKSSLINMLCERNKLAKTSGKPGKTQLINHFEVNDWYLVDLPGYGYAKVSKKDRKKFKGMIYNYMAHRENLQCVFVLVDSRIPPQKLDLEFMEWLGKKGIPFVIVFTKIEKLSSAELNKNIKAYKKEMLKVWESMPTYFSSSAHAKLGRESILGLIHETNQYFKEREDD